MYLPLAELPTPTEARFVGSEVVQVDASVKDHVRNVKRTVSKSIFLGKSSALSSVVEDISDVVASAVSPYGTNPPRVVLRETSEKKRFVEIWLGGALIVSKEVSELHGAFYGDDFFASLSFGISQHAILYTAEANPPGSNKSRESFRYTPDLGEGFGPNKRPTIFLFRWEIHDSGFTTTLSALSSPDKVLLGQATFDPSSERKVYATGYEYTADGRLLGLRYCLNRPCGIWELELLPLSLEESTDDQKPSVIQCLARKLTPSYLSCRSPRVLRAGGKSTLFWLSHPTGGAHAATSSLHSLDITSKAELERTRVLVDTVWTPDDTGFPGLYSDFSLPSRPFLRLQTSPSSGPDYLITHSVWGSRTTVLLISLADGRVSNITPDDGLHWSWSVLATDEERRVICVRSTHAVPPEIVLGQFDDTGDVSWLVIDKPHLPQHVAKSLAAIQVSIHRIPDCGPLEIVLVQSSESKLDGAVPPCCLIPHGGPHSVTTTAFSVLATALALEGYTLVMPNYTGSVGFGETAVRALLGRCGSKDVQDCMNSLQYVLDRGIAQQGPGKLFVMGGSHGGFLGAHLIGQFPDMFTAAALGNPVISAGEISTSDIQDWYFSEFGIEYPLSSSACATEAGDARQVARPPPRMDSEMFSRLQAASPITHVAAVRARVLLLLGGSDRRVAPTQGLGYYHALKACRDPQQQNDVELLWFEGEGHPVDGVAEARVSWEATLDLFDGLRK